MKRIEVVHLKPSEIKTGFGNPRKITKKALEDLKKSIERLDDFGVIVIDELHNVISGNQRIEAMKQLGIDTPILCKKLIGYTDAEKKAVNIKANTSSGEYDENQINEWLKDAQSIIDIEIDDIMIDNEEDFDIKENEIKSYNNVYVFLTIPVSKLFDVNKILKELQNIEGIEYDQSEN